MAEPDAADATVFERYVAALKAGDLAAILATLSPAVVLHSPVTRRFRFSGIEEVGELFEILFAELGVTNVEILQEVPGDKVAVLFHRATVGKVPIEEATLLRFGDDGSIAEITLYIRPLPSLAGILAALAPPMGRRQSRPREFLARAATAPLALITRRGDALAPWFAGRSGR